MAAVIQGSTNSALTRIVPLRETIIMAERAIRGITPMTGTDIAKHYESRPFFQVACS
jgi:hypothetical protein